MFLVPHQDAPLLLKGERIKSDVTDRVGSDRWRIVRTRISEEDLTDGLRIFLNGQRILFKSGEYEYDAVLIRWPFEGRLLAVSQHSGAGHGMWTRLYRADAHGLTDLHVELSGEANGPAFRRFKGSDKLKVVFDNDDWYTFGVLRKPPSEQVAYRYDGHRLRLWRRFSIRNCRRLPHHLPW